MATGDLWQLGAAVALVASTLFLAVVGVGIAAFTGQWWLVPAIPVAAWLLLGVLCVIYPGHGRGWRKWVDR